METGIYKITCSGSNKVYIGSAFWVKKRWSTHKVMLRQNKHHNQHLQNAFNSYGEKSFIFEIVEECSKENLEEREQFWIDFYKCYDRDFGYNVFQEANRSKMSEETKQKISIAHKGKKKSEETKKRMKIAQQNRTEEWKNNIAKSKIGRKHSEDVRKKLSDIKKEMYLNGYVSPLKGIPLKEETKKKRLESLIKRYREVGYVNKNIGSKRSEESRKKMSEVHKGKIPSNTKKCYCVETMEQFNSISDAARKFNITTGCITNSIKRNSKCCKGKYKFIIGEI